VYHHKRTFGVLLRTLTYSDPDLSIYRYLASSVPEKTLIFCPNTSFKPLIYKHNSLQSASGIAHRGRDSLS
jgi:hypothetical protein